MEYINFGSTGMQVSKLCLGCMTYGSADAGGPHDWTLGEEQSTALIKQAIELGINFFDTANVYSNGSSEVFLGNVLRKFAHRDEVVIATKAFAPWRNAPNTGGLSRKALMQSIDDSLQRLGTDYVDLYQIHRLDENTPIEETLEALHDIVKAGKARYIGASSMYAWQFSKALAISERRGWSRFVSMQNHVNLLYREEEREMLPLCVDEGIAVIPWSPLARGRLTRDWDETTERNESDVVGKWLYDETSVADKRVVEAVGMVAERHSVPRAQIALAWVLSKSEITAPIVGASKSHHLTDAVAALALTLTDQDITDLESAYVPHAVVGIDTPSPTEPHLTLLDN